MSAPLSGSASGSPSSGYYPDPSIPGYIRYWDGSSWTAGTSRPAPPEGEPMPAPPPQAVPPASPDSPAPAAPASQEGAEPGDGTADPRGNSAAAWRADAAQQSGEGASPVSWGARATGPEEQQETPAPARRDGTVQMRSLQPGAGEPAAGKDEERAPAPEKGPGTVRMRALQPGAQETEEQPSAAADRPEGTVRMRALEPNTPQGGTSSPGEETDGGTGPGTVRMRALGPGGSAKDGGVPERTAALRRLDAPQQGAQPPQLPPSQRPVQPLPGQGTPPAPVPAVPEPRQPSWAAPAPAFPHQGLPPQQQGLPPQQGMPPQQGLPPGPGGMPGPEGVVPWRPPVDDPFLAAARQQARPAGPGRRFGAGLVDGLVSAVVVGGAGFPLVSSAVEHIGQKTDAVRQAGETQRVWLIDGTTGGLLAALLGILLVFGLLYEVLPTVRWGRTLGKKLFGLKVMDLESHSEAEFRAVLVRWLVRTLLMPLAIGIVGLAWCLFDRPWRQGWHDKAGRTFVAEEEKNGGIGLA